MTVIIIYLFNLSSMLGQLFAHINSFNSHKDLLLWVQQTLMELLLCARA